MYSASLNKLLTDVMKYANAWQCLIPYRELHNKNTNIATCFSKTHFYIQKPKA
jgi:hypothetical protein